MEEFVDTSKKDKLKNKKKDIITPDNYNPIPKVEKKTDEPKVEDVNSARKVTFKDQIEINTFDNKENKKESLGGEKQAKPNTKNDAKVTLTMNTISFNIQLLLSMYNAIDLKLYYLLNRYLSPEHIRNILEERDSREICGNILCGKGIHRPKNKKYYYDAKQKDFIKDDIIDYFCDIKCFQKFKELTKLSQAFDYFTLLRVDFLVMLTVLPEYFPEVKYIEKISELSKTILEEKKPDTAEVDRIKLNYQKYFDEEEEETSGTKSEVEAQPIIFV
jgi:hypothetical protein